MSVHTGVEIGKPFYNHVWFEGVYFGTPPFELLNPVSDVLHGLASSQRVPAEPVA